MFPMTVTINNASQLSAVMAALNVDQIDVKPVAAPVEKEVAAAPAGKSKATSAETTAKPAPTPRTAAEAEAAAPAKKVEQSATTPPAAAPAASPATPKAEVTYQDAATAITKLSREKGRDTAVALLAKFDAANLKEVKPEQFAAVIAAATEAMGA